MASRIPPLSFNTSGSTADQIVDRLALHLRSKVPNVFTAMTTDEISSMFGDLRDEIARLVHAHSSHEQED